MEVQVVTWEKTKKGVKRIKESKFGGQQHHQVATPTPDHQKITYISETVEVSSNSIVPVVSLESIYQ